MAEPEPQPTTRLRLDKYLWHARVIKTRTLAQKFIASGVVRVDGVRITGSDYRVTAGMVLTFSLNDNIKIYRILDVGTRRGPAPEAQKLYENISPVAAPREKTFRPAPAALREPGAGRPTKRERRETDRFVNR